MRGGVAGGKGGVEPSPAARGEPRRRSRPTACSAGVPRPGRGRKRVLDARRLGLCGVRWPLPVRRRTTDLWVPPVKELLPGGARPRRWMDYGSEPVRVSSIPGAPHGGAAFRCPREHLAGLHPCGWSGAGEDRPGVPLLISHESRCQGDVNGELSGRAVGEGATQHLGGGVMGEIRREPRPPLRIQPGTCSDRQVPSEWSIGSSGGLAAELSRRCRYARPGC
jgi:hypothetical protein